MTKRLVEADERTVAVDHAAGNQAYKVMAWVLVAGLLVRSRWPEVANWQGYPMDTLAALLAGCLTWTWHAWRNQIISRKHLRSLILSLVAGGIVAAVLVRLLH